MTVTRYIPAATIAEYVVSHRILSANRFDPATIVVTEAGEPSSEALAATVCEIRAEQVGYVTGDDLTARQTRRRVQAAERVMACTVCTHTHREADDR